MSLNATKAAVVTALKADATLTTLASGGVFDAPAPQGSAPPFITIQLITGMPAYTMGQRAWDDRVWQIKGITTGTSKALGGSISDRIDSVLTDQQISVTGTTLMYLRREQDFDYPEVSDGQTYHHIGGMYRLWTA